MSEERIHTPVVLGFGNPFRLVLREGESWNPSLDQINKRSYDYVKLHRLSDFFDIGVQPFSLGVCFDGGLVLPALEQYQNPDTALRTFNRFLCECLLGGLYCEAIVPDDVVAGSMSEYAYTRIASVGSGKASSLHRALRTKHAGPLQTIDLLTPEITTVSQVKEAWTLGRERLRALGNITPETFLYGITFIARGQWSEALIHLWTTVEQVVEEIWKDHMLGGPSLTAISKKRRDDFLEDHRSWPVSVKLEVLFQKNLLLPEVYALLDKARAARNHFAHSGVLPATIDAMNAMHGLMGLASGRISKHTSVDVLSAVASMILDRCNRINPWEPQENRLENVSHWLALPPIPGDSHWGDKPFEKIEELRLTPIHGTEKP